VRGLRWMQFKTTCLNFIKTSACGARPVLVSRASRSAVASFCRKVVPAGAATAAGWSQGAGCLDSLRMLSSRSATAVNGSQLAR